MAATTIVNIIITTTNLSATERAKLLGDLIAVLRFRTMTPALTSSSITLAIT